MTTLLRGAIEWTGDPIASGFFVVIAVVVIYTVQWALPRDFAVEAGLSRQDARIPDQDQQVSPQWFGLDHLGRLLVAHEDPPREPALVPPWSSCPASRGVGYLLSVYASPV